MHYVAICITSKSVIFKVPFQTGDINIFVIHGVIYVLHFQIKGSFSSEKIPTMEYETYFYRKAAETWQSIKEIFYCWQKLKRCKAVRIEKRHCFY